MSQRRGYEVDKANAANDELQSTPFISSPVTSKINFSSKSAFFFAIIIPLIIPIAWQINNRQLPKGDSAQYLQTSYNIYLPFRRSGAVEGLKDVYFKRWCS